VKEGSPQLKLKTMPANRSVRPPPLPDDWMLPPEVRQLAIEAGYDPDEVAEELADWVSAPTR